MKILVVGGAGYVGSHMVKMLGESGHEAVTLDNLSSGQKDKVTSGKIILGDLADTNTLDRLFYENKFDAVMHFASFIEVSESIQNPLKYYENNVSNTINLLKAMKMHDVSKLIFSSTAAIFGEPVYTPIDEDHPQRPINPYGHTKLMIENILKDCDKAYGLKSVCLRYFNAAGADPDGELGECHEPETHLIPLVLQVAAGRRKDIKVFGSDYDTKDGTCVRDYIHIVDLCDAHLKALQALCAGMESKSFNLGNGNGFSVKKVISVAEKVTGRQIKVIDAKRRVGDPAILVANSSSIKEELNWEPKYADLTTIIAHAWNWEQKNFL
jgi:UDP-glucose 4-epimerase